MVCTCDQCDSAFCSLQLTALIKPKWCVLLYCCACIHPNTILMEARRATRGGALGAFAHPWNFQNIASQFWHLQKLSNNTVEIFYSNHFFKKSLIIIFLWSYWLIISLQDISWNRPSDRKFRKWLLFNHKYAGIGKSFKMLVTYLSGIFYPFFRVPLWQSSEMQCVCALWFCFLPSSEEENLHTLLKRQRQIQHCCHTSGAVFSLLGNLSLDWEFSHLLGKI